MKGNVQTKIAFDIEDLDITLFYPILQSGFLVKARSGSSVRSFLSDEMGFREDTIEEIKTIFLDGKPVDDIDTALITENAHLTFSAAMPGLVGMTLSRGSLLAAFRGSITHREEAGRGKEEEECTIVVKLLNLMIKELGPAFLQKGIYAKSDLLLESIEKDPEEFRKACRKIFLNERPVELQSVQEQLRSQSDYVYLLIQKTKN